MNKEHIELINIGVAHIIAAYIQSDTPFHLVMETTNWEPSLPTNIENGKKSLFSFVGDTLKECVVSNSGVYLFINISGNNYNYEVTSNSLIFKMFTEHPDKKYKPGEIIYNTPQFQLEEYIDEEDGKKHSLSMLMSNNDNEKFFK